MMIGRQSIVQISCLPLSYKGIQNCVLIVIVSKKNQKISLCGSFLLDQQLVLPMWSEHVIITTLQSLGRAAHGNTALPDIFPRLNNVPLLKTLEPFHRYASFRLVLEHHKNYTCIICTHTHTHTFSPLRDPDTSELS